MSRYRLAPTAAQEVALRDRCAHARYVWNLAAEQESWWRPGRRSAPGYLDQCRQLTPARAHYQWLRAGSQMVQQQALRDFAQAKANFYAGTRRRPTWRKAGRDEGFRIVAVKTGHVRRLSRKNGAVRIPKAAFAAIPAPVLAPGTGEAVGLDRGVAVSAALSTGEMLTAPRLGPVQQHRLRRLQRKLARARRGSNHRAKVKRAIATLRAREADKRKDWAEKTSTDLARRFDVIRMEDLKIRNMTRSPKGTIAEPGRNVRAKAGLNRSILASCWGLSCCMACGYTSNADVNAAQNIAAGHAVTARGGLRATGPVNRELQLLASLPGDEAAGIPALSREDVKPW